MPDCSPRLLNDLLLLAVGYVVIVSEDYRWFITKDFKLPPGYDYSSTDVLVEAPEDYPCSPPGVGGSHVYLPLKLRFKGRKLPYLHEYVTPGWGEWAWYCFQSIQWDPIRDDLVNFMEIIRTELTNPRK